MVFIAALPGKSNPNIGGTLYGRRDWDLEYTGEVNNKLMPARG